MFSAIVVTDNKYGISKNGDIPEEMNSKEDKRLFKMITNLYKQNAVVMGRKTWESIGKVLTGRINIVISSTMEPQEGIEVYRSPEELLMNTQLDIHYWIIGGEDIYRWFYEQKLLMQIYAGFVDIDCSCDRFLGINLDDFVKADFNYEGDLSSYKMYYYRYKNTEEQNFLNVIKDVIQKGTLSTDRTGCGTIRSFGFKLEFDLISFPLMTTRRHPFKWIFEELMWVLRGQRDVSILEKKGINIWTPNSRADFIKKQNLDIYLEEGDIGLSYGFNMRKFSEENYDQLANVIFLLKNHPDSRRIIINLWNPVNVKKSALPPCLCWYQFFVRGNYLDCLAMNRSSDIAIAGGWNIATASLLVYMLSSLCGYSPGRLTWIAGDTHIYNNNIATAKLYSDRSPMPFPKLFIKKKLNTLEDMLALEFSDVKLMCYHGAKALKFLMNA
jgi:thymidylate synthase